jgi:hypothetical protein
VWAERQAGVIGTPLKIGDRQRGVSASVVRVSRKKISTAGVGIYSQVELWRHAIAIVRSQGSLVRAVAEDLPDTEAGLKPAADMFWVRRRAPLCAAGCRRCRGRLPSLNPTQKGRRAQPASPESRAIRAG